MSNSPKFSASSHTDNLMDRDPENDRDISSEDDEDDSDDAITSYARSALSSPIQSFGNPTLTPAGTHPDNSQFSSIAQVGTPNIIRQAQSLVTSAPSLIRDARIAAAPYSTSHSCPSSGPASRQSSNPPTCPSSRNAQLPTLAAAFGLPPSTATPLSYITEKTPHPQPPPMTKPKDTPPLPFFEKVTVPPLVISPTIPGLVPEEWC